MDPLQTQSGIPGVPKPPTRDSRSEETEALHPGQEFLLRLWTEYRTPLIGGLICLLAAAALVTWMGQTREQRVQNAAIRLNRASAVYNQIVLNPEIGREVADQLLTEVIQLCDMIREEYPGLEAAHLALYLKGSCHFERVYHYFGVVDNTVAREYLDQAINAFRQYLDEATDDLDEARATIAIAACYENRSFLTDSPDLMSTAIEELERAAEIGEGTYLESQALMAQARCHEALDHRDEAREIYQRIIQLREPLAASVSGGPFGLMLRSSGGFNELAQERLSRIESGVVATPQS
jgi:tetratricopeptide (TPR) repeat protein